MKNFNGYLTNVGSHKSFFNIIFPSSIGEISNSLGMGVFLFYYLISRKINIDLRKNERQNASSRQLAYSWRLDNGRYFSNQHTLKLSVDGEIGLNEIGLVEIGLRFRTKKK